ncbi:hypothetical protein K457DRAFT_18741 [Linnemannia elongata AG-77]|uniref:Uncharacterized protein n=1 Tax=Linnemannia elongata AG-77 TaxID=1314771 RepID=A0A197JXD5_9FUNG|nr:hypothetical protein K457DRAFT_18741 [Linnemannia elongata AG-77]
MNQERLGAKETNPDDAAYWYWEAVMLGTLGIYLVTGCLHVYLSWNEREEGLNKHLSLTFLNLTPIYLIVVIVLVLHLFEEELSTSFRNLLSAVYVGTMIGLILNFVIADLKIIKSLILKPKDNNTVQGERSHLLPQ